ncbi:MAG TPA: hypothetical protein VJ964_12805 [Balneolaceae bacterium]|nr:hypothetical protein [Balneolaceae bacterium]
MKNQYKRHELCFFVTLFIAGQSLKAQDSTATDSVSIEQIRKQMEDAQSKEPKTPSRTKQTQSVQATSINLNPDISAITDFRSLYTSQGDRNWDAYLQGVELNLRAAIDPYARADIYPVFEGEQGQLNAKIEEAYLLSLSLPYRLQLKVGKFRQAFGRINTVHQHALPIIDLPVASEAFLGETLIDQGASLSWLLPNRAFYQELIVSVTRGPDESPLFAVSDHTVPLKLVHLKNFWTLTDNATLELGLSGAMGSNEAQKTSRLGGIDLTYIWKPVRFNTYKSFKWQSELFFSNTETASFEKISAWGMYSWMEYQLSRRWFVTGMYSYTEDPNMRGVKEQATSATFGWYATEFQKLEFGPKLYTDNGFSDVTFSGLFRWIFVIGMHGAHQY